MRLGLKAKHSRQTVKEEEEVPLEAAPEPHPLSPIQEMPAPKRRGRVPRKVRESIQQR